MVYLSLEDMEKQIEAIKNSEDLWSAVKSLQLFASNERSLGVSELVDKTIEKCRLLDDKKSISKSLWLQNTYYIQF